jgi:hypothetical protein
MEEKDKKTRNIERAMRECFEEIGIPKLTKDENSKLSKTVMDGADDICGFGISLFYDDYYYNRATIRIVTDKRIPAEKEAPVRELLNIINSDLAFDHFCLEPGNHMVCFQTGFWVPGDDLPRAKFKKLLQQFFEDYCRYTPMIIKLLVEGGEPEELWCDYLLNTTKLKFQGGQYEN